MFSQVLTSVLAFVWTILLARYLGVNDYGIFGFAVSMTALFGVFNDFGVGTQIVRAMAADNSVTDKYLGNAISLRFVFALIYSGIILSVLLIMHSSPQTILITMLFTLEIIIKNFSSLCNSTFNAHQRTKYQAF